jgi:very-short-patch-repair endonuclease
MTNAERVLWGEVRAHRLSGFKLKRQEPLGVYVVDFVCYEARLIIELDGGHHANQQEADAERTLWLESSGFRVIRFWNNDVLSNIAEVMQEIEREITAPLPLSSVLSREGRASSESLLSSGHRSPSSSKSPFSLDGRGPGRG